MYTQRILSNGIRVIGQRMGHYRSVAVGFWVNAGSVTETSAQSGYSHFIEHMLFKGTQNRSAKQIAIDMDRLGGQINAFTAKECTCYYAKVAGDKLKNTIDILADMLCASVFDETELEREKGVVIEEISMSKDNPEDLVHENVSEAFFEGTCLSSTILGPAENIQNTTRDTILEYMRRRYTPENIVVSLAGNFDMDAAIEYLEESLKCFSNEGAALHELVYTTKCPNKFIFTEKDVEQTHMCLSFPSYPITGNEKYALSVFNNILGGSMSSRLFQRIREQSGMAYAVYSYPSQYTGSGMFTIYTATAKNTALEVAKMAFEEMDKIKQGISQDELSQSKEQLIGNYILAQESTSARMNVLGKSMLLGIDIVSEEFVKQQIENVTLKDMHAIMDYILNKKQMTAAFVGKLIDEAGMKQLCEYYG